MEKIENYAVSEENLEEVVGGFNVNKELVKKVVIGTGVTALTVCSVLGVGAATYHFVKKRRKKDVTVKHSESSAVNKPVNFEEEWSNYMFERMNQED